MAGEPVQAVAHGLASLVADLQSNPQAIETVSLSVIEFASRAVQSVPLVELMDFRPPPLRLGSGTALGDALRLMLQALDREVVPTTAERKGDWKPICVLLTDGEPTDEWEATADHVRKTVCGRRANVIAICCGPDANVTKLRRITEIVIRARDVHPGTLGSLFRWVTASVSVASVGLGTAGSELNLPALPAGALEVAPTGVPPPAPDRLIFLHCLCQKTKKLYLAKYERTGARYTGAAAIPVDDFDLTGAAGATVSTGLLDNHPNCPRCGNFWWAMCRCGKVFCSPQVTTSLRMTCPWCEASDDYSSRVFDVGRGLG
jgi:uncharacterized protein YegL